MKAKAPSPAALAIVYATVFIDLLGFGIILPSLPYYARALGASGFSLGLLFTSYSLAQFVGSAVLGRLSDRRGRRPILLASLLGSSASMALSGFAGSLLTLAAARALAGLFGGSIATAQAYIADVAPREERARYMGLLGASIGLGFVLGPALGAGILALGGGFAGSAFVASGLAALNFVLAYRLLPESRPAGQGARSERLTPAGLVALLARPNLWQALAATFLTTFAFVALEATLAFFAKDRFDITERRFGGLLVYVGVVVIVVQGGLIGRLTKALGVRRVAVAGELLMGAALLALPLSPSAGAMLAVLGLVAAGQAMCSPTLSTLVSRAGTSEDHGTLLGAGQSLAAAARAASPLLAGALYDAQPAAPYVLSGLLAALAGALVLSSSET
jgi:DHA1 family tetracycline resistance protein-like MFS transporter